MNGQAQRFELFDQVFRTAVVKLLGHETRGEFDYVGGQPQVAGGSGRFEPQESTSKHRTPLRAFPVRHDVLKVLKRAVNEHALLVDSFDRRNKRGGTGCQHKVVVRETPAFSRSHPARLTIDRLGAVANVDRHAVVLVPFHPSQSQFFMVAVRKERTQRDAIVRGTRFLAKSRDAERSVGIVFDEFLDEMVAHHSVADYDDVLFSDGFHWRTRCFSRLPKLRARAPERRTLCRQAGRKRDRSGQV